MIRNIKLGLALLAALAVGAVAASAAAAEWEAEGGEAEAPTYLTGTQGTHNGKSFHSFKMGSYELSCKNASFTGQMPGNKQAKLTLHPTYENCTTSGGLPVTITMHTCDFVLYAGTQSETNEHHFFDGAMDIECENAPKNIEIHVYPTVLAHFMGISICTLKVPPQGPLVATTYTNTTGAKHDIDLTTELSSIMVEVEGDKDCGAAQQEATYKGATTLRAFSDISHTSQINLLYK